MYLQLIQKLFQLNVFGGMKLGLQNAHQLQQMLHFPNRSFTSIHVAGTNGKGSVSTKIAHAFEKAGYLVGLFTSPHLSSFRERIQINGKMISEKAVEELLSFLFATIEKGQIPATFFEVTTFLSLLYFAQQKVDIAVIETGLGGRLDATNIITPCLSIITSISLDHTEILGTTREAIAQEKGGIIKQNVPVVIGPRVPLAPIQAIAAQKNSLCIQVKEHSLLFEEENQWVARTALRYLATQFYLPLHAIEPGLKSKQPCRFEVIAGDPLIILDVAHNPDGLEHLFQTIQSTYPLHRLRVLTGISKSKDLAGCLSIIAKWGQQIHLVEARNGRGASTHDLYSYLRRLAVDSSCLFTHDSIFAGIQYARQEALQQGQILVVCGSFFIMGEARKALGFSEPYDEIDLNEAR